MENQMRGSAADMELAQRLPTHEEITSAAEAASILAKTRADSGAIQFSGPDGGALPLAPAIGELIVELLGHIARGHMVTLVPTSAMLTTQQAADILNVSRPFLSKLLKEQKIPFVLVGSHRRVQFSDLMEYKERRDAGRLKALEELARLGQEYEDS